MSIIALIPARSGSQRIPGKNIKDFFGHPLMAYTIQVAKDCGLFDNVYVCSDFWQYLDIAKKYGALPINRSAKSSTPDSKDIEWVKEALHFFDSSDPHPNPDIFAILRPTNPFRNNRMLARAMIKFLKYKPRSLRAVERVKQHPFKMWGATNTGLEMMPAYQKEYLHEHGTHTFPPLYAQNGSLEIFWSEMARDNDNITGTEVMPFFTTGYEGFDINTPEDWILAEELVKRGMAKLPEVK